MCIRDRCIIMSYLHREDEFLSGANGNAMSYSHLLIIIIIAASRLTLEYKGLKPAVFNARLVSVRLYSRGKRINKI